MYPKFASNINVERLDALIKLVLRLLALSIDGSDKAILGANSLSTSFINASSLSTIM